MGGDLQKYRAPVHVAMLTEGGRKDFLDAVGAPAGYDVGAGGLAPRSEEWTDPEMRAIDRSGGPRGAPPPMEGGGGAQGGSLDGAQGELGRKIGRIFGGAGYQAAGLLEEEFLDDSNEGDAVAQGDDAAGSIFRSDEELGRKSARKLGSGAQGSLSQAQRDLLAQPDVLDLFLSFPGGLSVSPPQFLPGSPPAGSHGNPGIPASREGDAADTPACSRSPRRPEDAKVAGASPEAASEESQCGEAKVARLLEDVERILVNIVCTKLIQYLAGNHGANHGLPLRGLLHHRVPGRIGGALMSPELGDQTVLSLRGLEEELDAKKRTIIDTVKQNESDAGTRSPPRRIFEPSQRGEAKVDRLLLEVEEILEATVRCRMIRLSCWASVLGRPALAHQARRVRQSQPVIADVGDSLRALEGELCEKKQEILTIVRQTESDAAPKRAAVVQAAGVAAAGPSKAETTLSVLDSSSAWSAVLAKAEENKKKAEDENALAKALREDVLQRPAQEMPYLRA